MKMLSRSDFIKATGVGIVTALILTAIALMMSRSGLTPLPKPPSLAFAETIMGTSLPLPVGLLFHVVYVTGWSVIFVTLFRDQLSYKRALLLALFLWLVALVVFFPIIGWGFFGLAISPKLIIGALGPHVIFSIVLWGLCRVAFGNSPASA